MLSFTKKPDTWAAINIFILQEIGMVVLNEYLQL